MLAVGSGMITATSPCGSYLQPYSCLEIDVRYQLVFIASGGTIGCLFYFVNVMHKSKLAFRMELMLGLEGVLLAMLWLILPRYDPYFSETAYFAEMFTVSVIVALAAFLAIDHLWSKSLLKIGRAHV